MKPIRFPPHAPLIGILAVYAALVTAYALRTPAWQAPDEPAHYRYIAQISEDGCCPVIEMGDWDQAYLSELTTARFAPERLGRLETLQYEDHQPPLYYLIGALVYRLTGGSMIALRLYSAFLGGIGVTLTYAAGRVAFPSRPLIAAGAAAFVAFIPQHLAILASVNNDAAADVVIGTGLLAALIYGRGGALPAWLLGVIVGVGLVTKANTLSLIGVIIAAILLRARLHVAAHERAGFAARQIAMFALPALLIGAVWWVRNISVYGFPDLLGLGAHDRVVAGQPRTAEILAQVGWGEYLRRAAETTFQSFWGQFGWMALPLPQWMYVAILIGTGLLVLGGVIGLLRRPAENPDGDQRVTWLLVWLMIGLAVAQYGYYNSAFYQVQGRYLYPALLPLGLLAGWSIDGWGRLWAARGILLRSAALLLVLALIPLNLYLVWRVIPLLAP